jgi:hypothetical protein
MRRFTWRSRIVVFIHPRSFSGDLGRGRDRGRRRAPAARDSRRASHGHGCPKSKLVKWSRNPWNRPRTSIPPPLHDEMKLNMICTYRIMARSGFGSRVDWKNRAEVFGGRWETAQNSSSRGFWTAGGLDVRKGCDGAGRRPLAKGAGASEGDPRQQRPGSVPVRTFPDGQATAFPARRLSPRSRPAR